MTVARCKALAAERGLAFAGIRNGSYCVGGNDISRMGAVELSKCNMHCPGNLQEFCGGQCYFSMHQVAPQKPRECWG